jgi:hypothetical protein
MKRTLFRKCVTMFNELRKESLEMIALTMCHLQGGGSETQTIPRPEFASLPSILLNYSSWILLCDENIAHSKGI